MDLDKRQDLHQWLPSAVKISPGTSGVVGIPRRRPIAESGGMPHDNRGLRYSVGFFFSFPL